MFGHDLYLLYQESSQQDRPKKEVMLHRGPLTLNSWPLKAGYAIEL